ncbi:hypothetical protein BDV26DRAFT_289818 [Aspergillus bertholletiae]|uniref:EF-hand domain-containing protein n=1 Tax=Aspergillus bertholletiae TaxID=1226010 RepID=A0A5N7BH94_9EURO|nr:hypothetical protein BDV26DRAFT_289818 [Aspergillus bertholletiae]
MLPKIVALLGAVAMTAHAATIYVCTDKNLRGDCTDVEVSPGQCVNLPFGDNISSIRMNGFSCEFFTDSGCDADSTKTSFDKDQWNLRDGTWNDQLSSPAYSREEIVKWKEEFRKLNTDYDGYIDPYELIGTANEKGLGMTDEEGVAWVKKLDFDGDGRVSFGEFLTAFGKRADSS